LALEKLRYGAPCKLGSKVASRARKPSLLLSDCCVEKIVDFFPESGEEIQNFPLAKRCSFLVHDANPYLSITIRMATFLVG
jgi:hypothetical protein